VIVSFRNMWGELHGENEDIDLTILTARTIDEAKATASALLEDLFREGNEKSRLDIRYPKYYADMIISGIADIINSSESDLNEIKQMIMEVIRKYRKE
jgi:hypothetical protein